MKRGKQFLTALVLCGGVGLGAQSIFAQNTPGGQIGPSGSQPRLTQPTIPGQQVPGLPQTEPMPGGPGTIPERMQTPDAGSSPGAAHISAEEINRAKEALKAKGLNPGPMDGSMDRKTQQALRDFQKANKLPVTGMLDAQTAVKLGVALDKNPMPQRGPRGRDLPTGKGDVQ